MKTTLRVIAAVLILIVLGLLYLLNPAGPSQSRSLRLDGFVRLPSRGVFDLMDYLTFDGESLFVTGVMSGSVLKVSLGADRALRDSTMLEWRGRPSVHGVALVPSHDVAFVTRSGENTVDAFDPHALRELARIRVADDPDAILYDPSADLIYVTNAGAQAATLIDPVRRAVVATIALGATPEFPASDVRSGLIYQNLVDQNAIAAIDPLKRTVVGRWPLQPCKGPTGLAIDAASHRAFAVCVWNALLVVFDLDRHVVVGSLKIGRLPDSVAIDPVLHRIYTAGALGTLAVAEPVRADTYRTIDQIHTRLGVHTLAVDPLSHRVFLGYGGLVVGSGIAVLSPKP